MGEIIKGYKEILGDYEYIYYINCGDGLRKKSNFILRIYCCWYNFDLNVCIY